MPPPPTSLAEKLLGDLILQVFRATTQLIFQIYLGEVRRVESREEGILRVAAIEEDEEEEEPYQIIYFQGQTRGPTLNPSHINEGTR